MVNIADGFLWYLAFLFSTVLHEASHAFTAMKLGDTTAYEGGQVTLDPRPHLRREPLGMVLVPLVSFFINGWMIGWASAPYDPMWAHNYPKRSAMMALAGPLANLFLVVVAFIIIRIGVAADWFYAPETITFTRVVATNLSGMLEVAAKFLSIVFSLNLLLLVLNLLPLPPLDGSGIIPFLLNRRQAIAYMDFVHSGYVPIIGILIAWHLIGYVFSPMFLIFIHFLFPGAGYH